MALIRNRSLSPTTSTHRARLKIRAGFTLVELMVVIAIISLLSIGAFYVLGNNSSLQSSTERDKVLLNLRTAKKEALLQNFNPAQHMFVLFQTGQYGYSTYYSSQGVYDITPVSFTRGTSGSLPNYTISYKASAGITPSLKPFLKNHKQSVTQVLDNTDGTPWSIAIVPGNIDSDLSFYYQNPNNAKEESNTIGLSFFSKNNLDDFTGNDVRVETIESLKSDGSVVTLNELKISFDTFGRAFLTDENNAPVAKAKISFARDSSPAVALPDLQITLPDDI